MVIQHRVYFSHCTCQWCVYMCLYVGTGFFLTIQKYQGVKNPLGYSLPYVSRISPRVN